MTTPELIACPDAHTLEQFLLGRAPAAEAERLEAHLAQCPRCPDTARSLPCADDLVRALHGADRTGPLPQQELIEALIPLLKRLRPRTENTTLPPTLDPGDATRPSAGAPVDCLAPPQAADEIGRLGPYRVLRQLGAGGMGVVFLAEDPRLRRQIALKIIQAGLVARTDVRERFLREARAIAAVEHDHIVTIHHVGEENGLPYLAMPLLRGQSLEDRLKQAEGPLGVDEVLRIGSEIAGGLAAAHARGLIHRDIKPANIWLEQVGSGQPPTISKGKGVSAALTTGRVKILDFGLAQALEGEESGLARERGVTGTPAYMSPEQGSGQAVDARSDLFSLGCVLYRVATGRPPFQGDNLLSLLMSVAMDQPAPPRTLNFDVPPALADLIVQLLAKRPTGRPASAQEVAERLQALAHRRQRRRWLRRWALATCAVVALAIALTGWLLARAYHTHIWPQLSRARTLSAPVFRGPVLTVLTSRVRSSFAATPRGSVIAVTTSPADGTKHISEVCQRAFCLGTTTVRPCGRTPQKLLRTPRRPVKAASWTWASDKAALVTLVRGLLS